MADVDDAAVATVKTEAGTTGTPVIRLAGEIDTSNVDAVSAQIDRVLPEAHEPVVFDLADLGYMDSAGLAMLLRVAERVPGIRIRNASALIRQIIEVTGLTPVLPLE